MPQTRQPLFLARASYRKRRLRDGARLLPIFGFLLLVLPLLWVPSVQGVAPHWGFVFVVWAGLIGIAAALSHGLSESEGLIDKGEGQHGGGLHDGGQHGGGELIAPPAIDPAPLQSQEAQDAL